MIKVACPHFVFFGAFDEKTGVCGSCQDLSNSQCFNHTIEVEGGIFADECRQLLQQFFVNRRKKI